MTARVNIHLTLQEQREQITRYSKQLEELVRERTHLLIHADRLATLGTFSAAVAHEINNPVSYIMGNVELLKYTWNIAGPILENHVDEDETGHLNKSLPKVTNKLNLIMDGAERVAELARNFRAYSRQADLHKKDCRLIDVVNDASNLLVHRFKRGYILDMDVPREVKVHGDPHKLSQVFVNLFNNAMDAMAEGKGRIRVEATRANGRIDIRVNDEGPGINGDKSKIFEPYFTTKPKEIGTGLGLFIVRSILEEHDGDIRIDNVSDTGAQFDIRLPSA